MNRSDRIRQLLDMYSARWPQRLAVFVVIATGGWLLATGRLQGLLPFALLVWANHERFFASMSERFRRHPWLVLAPACVVMAARIVKPAPAAHDDLLRHIASAFWPGGYHDMYVYAKMPAFDAYVSFEWLVHALALRAGPLWTMWIVQATAWTAFVLVFVAAARRVLPRDDDRWYWILGALLVTISAVAIRLTLGRPEIFMTIWALAALLPATRAGIAAWAAAGLLACTGYWLSPIYFPAVLMLPLSWRARALLFVLMGALWFVIWYVLSGANPLLPLAGLGEALGSRVMTVGENASVVNLLALPGFVLLAAAAVWAAFQPRRDLRLLLLAAWFLMSDQVRYVSIAAPLLALFALSALPTARLALRPGARFGAVAISVLLAPAAVASIPRLYQMPAFDIPAGSVVLSGFTVASYAVPFHNAGIVRSAPAFEIGVSEPWLQQVARDIALGEFRCEAVEGRGFTYLVENSLRMPAPDCLRLAAVDRGWRLWRLSP